MTYDVVYVTKAGENPELRYSLRSLRNVTYQNVWVVGGTPSWLSIEVGTTHRDQPGNPYQNVQGNIRAACLRPDISDPFYLWDDDIYAMRVIGDIPTMNRGTLESVSASFISHKSPWLQGLQEVLRWAGPDAWCFDHHLPLLIHKAQMMEALYVIGTFRHPTHLRTVYGKIAGLKGTTVPDPKMNRRSDPFPIGPWLSSGDSTFRGCIEPVLRYTFPVPGRFEI